MTDNPIYTYYRGKNKQVQNDSGSYYVYARIEDDGTLSLGEEQGSYAGGITLSADFNNGDYIRELKAALDAEKQKMPKWHEAVMKLIRAHNRELANKIEQEQ